MATNQPDRPGHKTVKANVYFEYNTYYFHPELTVYHLYLQGFFVRLKWFIKLNYLKRTVWLIWLYITLFKKGSTRAGYSARSLMIFYQVYSCFLYSLWTDLPGWSGREKWGKIWKAARKSCAEKKIGKGSSLCLTFSSLGFFLFRPVRRSLKNLFKTNSQDKS